MDSQVEANDQYGSQHAEKIAFSSPSPLAIHSHREGFFGGRMSGCSGCAVCGMERFMSEKERKLPTALTVIKAIAAADGKLKTSPAYLTKLQMIRLCKNWLKNRRFK